MTYRINPITWYSEREISQCPKHFVVGNTPLTRESKLWILNNLQGRFAVVKKDNTDDPKDDWLTTLFDLHSYPAFEDPKELLVYELTWT